VSNIAITNPDPKKACIPDPCATINCPSACWTCGVNPDGTGTCNMKQSPSGGPVCASVVTNVGQRGGGNQGCGCAVGAQGSGGAPTWLGLLLSLALVAARRRRR
jgi:MYXO-CTERM domain-containing protein